MPDVKVLLAYKKISGWAQISPTTNFAHIEKSMLEHSRGSSGELRSFDLNDPFEEALNLAYHGARAQHASFNITLERDFSDAIAPIELVPKDILGSVSSCSAMAFYAATKRQKEGSDPKYKPTLKIRHGISAMRLRSCARQRHWYSGRYQGHQAFLSRSPPPSRPKREPVSAPQSTTAL